MCHCVGLSPCEYKVLLHDNTSAQSLGPVPCRFNARIHLIPVRQSGDATLTFRGAHPPRSDVQCDSDRHDIPREAATRNMVTHHHAQPTVALYLALPKVTRHIADSPHLFRMVVHRDPSVNIPYLPSIWSRPKILVPYGITHPYLDIS